MHIQHSALLRLDPVVDISPPRDSPSGRSVFEPSINVWPAGQGTPERQGPYWAFSADEAEQLAGVLLQAAKDARELFPES